MEFKSNIPIYLQVINDIKHQIVNGTLKLGDKLPSTRELALKYQINPNTAVRIYNEMELMNLCYTKRGLGTFVTEDKERYDSLKEEMATIYIQDFIKGMSELGISKENVLKLIEKNF